MKLVVLVVLVACSGGRKPIEPERVLEPDLVKRDAAVDAPPPPIDAPAPVVTEMADVPSATLRMGSKLGHPDERPVHDVIVAAFSIDKTEVTMAAYATCVAAKACTLPDLQVPECTWGKAALDRYPINCVNFDQAVAYCAFAGKRLPTEQEWELAARGTDGRIYPYGNGAMGGEECEVNSADLPLCPVGSAPRGASPYGVLDMTGNADEWTASPYCPYDRPSCGDPRKSTRGGSSDFIGGTATSRTATPKNTIGAALGFRCAKS